MNTNDSSMPEVYAVYARESYAGRLGFELMELFSTEAKAEAYAELLRGAVEDGPWAEAPPVPAFSAVKVRPYSIR